jgi:hypothetical protein
MSAGDDGRTIFAKIDGLEKHSPDLRFWVELRGFEPLTLSMRTPGCEVVRGH